MSYFWKLDFERVKPIDLAESLLYVLSYFSFSLSFIFYSLPIMLLADLVYWRKVSLNLVLSSLKSVISCSYLMINVSINFSHDSKTYYQSLFFTKPTYWSFYGSFVSISSFYICKLYTGSSHYFFIMDSTSLFLYSVWVSSGNFISYSYAESSSNTIFSFSSSICFWIFIYSWEDNFSLKMFTFLLLPVSFFSSSKGPFFLLFVSLIW